MNNYKKFSYLSLIIILLCSTTAYAIGETSYSIGKGILKFLFYIFAIFVVIIITIYGTKLIAQGSKRFINSRYITILDRIVIDTSTKIILMEVNRCIYLLGISGDHMELIDKISVDDFEQLEFQNQLELQKKKYSKPEDSFIFKRDLEQLSNKLDKFFNKEDKNDEK